MVKHRVGGVDFSYLPSLDLGGNLDLISSDMFDIGHHGITADDESNTTTENIPYQVPHPVYPFNCKP